MNKAFEYFLWKNYSSTDTPLGEVLLNRINRALNEVDNRVILHDTTKFNSVDAQTLIKSLTFNQANGVFTITYFNGATATIDTMLEKLAVNFDFDENAQQLVIILDDGTEKRVDLSTFIKPIEFIDSDTTAWKLLDDGKVSISVKKGSITEEYIEPNYLGNIKVEVSKAQASAAAAASHANKAENQALLSKSWAIGDTGARDGEDTDNSKYHSEQSKASADTSKEYLTKVEKAGEDAVKAVQDTLDISAPEFIVDLSTGHLMYSGGRFDFQVNSGGHLLWGLTV